MTPLLLDIEEAATALKLPLGWLKHAVSARAVPHTRLGKHVRFSADDLAEIIAAAKQPAINA